MVAGFGGMLFLIIAVGLIGMQQIQGLSAVVSHLAKINIPMQNAVFEMKSSNSKYAMAIRNYMFWRSAKYLDAAAVAEKLNVAETASGNFDRNLAFYSSLVPAPSVKEWVEAVRLGQNQLRQIGTNIIVLIGGMEKAVTPETKKRADEAINKQLMDFENKLFWIDAFLDSPIQRYNMAEIDKQLAIAETGRRRSIVFLTWSLVIGLGLGAQTAYLIYRQSKREREHRELLWRKVIRLEEEERNNLSLQIHDQMGQDLSALKIFLGLVDREMPEAMQEQKEKIDKAKKILDALIGKTHNISELLRPPELDDLGLVDSIGALIMQYTEMTGAEHVFVKPKDEINLPPDYSLVLYRVVQEALTNIAKHSSAKKVEVFLEKKDDAIALMVTDDGVGFDSEFYLKSPRRRKEDKLRLGLQGLKERIELLGGSLRVHSQPGQGTQLKVLLPTV